MERKIEIPEMSKEDIVKWYSKMRPIVKDEDLPRYLRDLKPHELTDVSYTWLTDSSDYADVVDYSKLSALADVKMLHRYGYYVFFKPSVGEVIRQIPLEHLEKVVAFEIICGPIGMNTTFNKEFGAGYHVSIVRLYEEKNATNKEAKPLKECSDEDDWCGFPIGMEEKDFKALFG